MIREANIKDLDNLLELYLDLHEEKIPESSEKLCQVWDSILNDPNHHIILKEVDGILVLSCVCVIIPNLTRNVRPYALIENVVTRVKYRGKGYATECLNHAKGIAVKNNCYKMMLLTGSKEKSTLNFYLKAGYNNTDKMAFIQWLE
ncbi:MAG TPA: GNAT family N-acetyltransferase [Candidatus Mediterraneibacter norfolkensis]|nr:GNAT family N-acetyltransferase [Candidatus Mediterraneibacter norfolkensis]